MSRAYYNEIDPYAAAWLRNLIAAGHIAPGDVDERSIEDVRPIDLRDYSQCHFFAGVGVWSYALRQAGWPDDRPIWTGSCPCQPFSAAGKGNGFADERHLWPAFHWLIRECEPAVVAGEQVASRDADPWLDLVQTDLEALGYAFGAVAFPSAGVGAPHIRDRTYWVADAAGLRRDERRDAESLALQGECPERSGEHPRPVKTGELSGRSEGLGSAGWLGNDDVARLEGHGGGYQAASGRDGAIRPAAEAGQSSGVADAEHDGRSRSQGHSTESCRDRQDVGLYDRGHSVPQGQSAAGPTNGRWRAADWLLCRDGRWRPVEPGTFPLAHGAAARVGRLRAYGNAINAKAAEEFIRATL